MTPEQKITERRLESGYWHIRGVGPCNWLQSPGWPTTYEVACAWAFPEASEEFLRAVVRRGPPKEAP